MPFIFPRPISAVGPIFDKGYDTEKHIIFSIYCILSDMSSSQVSKFEDVRLWNRSMSRSKTYWVRFCTCEHVYELDSWHSRFSHFYRISPISRPWQLIRILWRILKFSCCDVIYVFRISYLLLCLPQSVSKWRPCAAMCWHCIICRLQRISRRWGSQTWLLDMSTTIKRTCK